MVIKARTGLILINLVVILLILVISFIPSSFLRIVIGLPFLLFLPGYTLIATLFPRKHRIDTFERLALSFGMSIAIVPLIGIALNYTPWGIRLAPVLYSVSAFISLMSVAAWWRSRGVPEQERLSIALPSRFPGWSGSALNKALSVALAIAILGTIGTLVYTVAFPKVGEKFSEFYVLNEAGKMSDYPRELTLGRSASVILGVINREYRQETYRIQVTANGTALGEVGPVILQDKEEWKQEMAFTPTSLGDGQKVEFLLFREADTSPYESLHIWVNVRGP